MCGSRGREASNIEEGTEQLIFLKSFSRHVYPRRPMLHFPCETRKIRERCYIQLFQNREHIEAQLPDIRIAIVPAFAPLCLPFIWFYFYTRSYHVRVAPQFFGHARTVRLVCQNQRFCDWVKRHEGINGWAEESAKDKKRGGNDDGERRVRDVQTTRNQRNNKEENPAQFSEHLFVQPLTTPPFYSLQHPPPSCRVLSSTLPNRIGFVNQSPVLWEREYKHAIRRHVPQIVDDKSYKIYRDVSIFVLFTHSILSELQPILRFSSHSSASNRTFISIRFYIFSCQISQLFSPISTTCVILNPFYFNPSTFVFSFVKLHLNET